MSTSLPPPTIQCRQIDGKIEHKERKISGMIPLNQRQEIKDWYGNYYETLLATAITQESLRSVDFVAQHNEDSSIANTDTNQRLRIWVDGNALRYEVSVPETREGDKFLEDISAGKYRGTSFKFSGWTHRTEQAEGKDHIIIENIGNMLDISAVVRPAYESTSLQARSIRFSEKQKNENAGVSQKPPNYPFYLFH